MDKQAALEKLEELIAELRTAERRAGIEWGDSERLVHHYFLEGETAKEKIIELFNSLTEKV
jgi:hypothetical protein